MATECCFIVDWVVPNNHSDNRRKSIIGPYNLGLFEGQAPASLNGVRTVTRAFDERATGPYNPALYHPDVLCLSYMTTEAWRAYQISEEARHATSHNGDRIRIIHGGIHATSLPLEALKHCDLVVRGEMTPQFQKELLEFALNMGAGYKAVLRMNNPPCVIKHPPADWSWAKRSNYMLPYTIQTSVGCPFSCDFCSVTQVAGAGMRPYDLGCLRTELATLPKGVVLAVIDDNFLQGVQPKHINHCLNVAKMMHGMGFRWMAELTIKTLIEARKKLAEETPGFDLVEFFAKHGCIGFFFGIESIDGGLKKSESMGKTTELIHHCQNCGIGVLGAFVLGVGPEETTDYAKRVVEYAIIDAKLDFAQFSINTPMPGARNFIEGVRSGNIFNYNWDLFDAEHCVMRHPIMTPDELEEAHAECYRVFYGRKSVIKRTLLPLLSLSHGASKRLIISALYNVAMHYSDKRRRELNQRAGSRTVINQPDQSVIDQVNNLSGGGSLFDFRNAAGGPDTFAVEYVEI